MTISLTRSRIALLKKPGKRWKKRGIKNKLTARPSGQITFEQIKREIITITITEIGIIINRMGIILEGIIIITMETEIITTAQIITTKVRGATNTITIIITINIINNKDTMVIMGVITIIVILTKIISKVIIIIIIIRRHIIKMEDIIVVIATLEEATLLNNNNIHNKITSSNIKVINSLMGLSNEIILQINILNNTSPNLFRSSSNRVILNSRKTFNLIIRIKRIMRNKLKQSEFEII